METQLLKLQKGMISRKSSAIKILLQSRIKGLGILLSLLLFMAFSPKSFAQIPTTAGWALYNTSATTIQPTTQIGNLVALPMNTGTDWVGPNSISVGNNINYFTTGSQNTYYFHVAKTSGCGAAYSPNGYLEFKVTANGSDVNLSTVQFSALETAASSGGKLAVYYSIDNDATSYANATNLGTATLGTATPSTSTSTVAAPIPLLRSDSVAAKTYPLARLGAENIKFSPNLVLANGKTFTLRIYNWCPNNPDKGFAIRNVIISSSTKWPLASMDASTVSSIAPTTATVSSGILDPGGDAITASGIIYNVDLRFYPGLSQTKVSTSPIVASGNFTASLTGLSANTAYIARSFATNASGYTAFGPLTTFTTSDALTGAVIPTITTTAVSAITSTSVNSGGTFSANIVAPTGGSTVTASGVVWNTTTGPTVALSTKTTENASTGSFVSPITGLLPNTTYFIKAYATNAAGTGYGAEVSFKTAAATITTDAITAITSTTATAGGNIVSDGGNTITESGVVYATATAPTTTASTKIVTSPLAIIGAYVSNLTGLTAATKYFVRTYVINTVASVATTTYGPEVSFTTANDAAATAPIMAATTVSGATATTATATLVITSNGGAQILGSGVVWSTATIPDATDINAVVTKRINGSGAIINLTPYTLYYARSYATNAIGTTYGAEVSFNSLNAASTLTATTIDAATISSTGVTANSSIINNGASITESGFVYNTATAPTIAHTKSITSGVTSGSNSRSLTGLTAGTTYYVRSYATYSASTAAANTLPTFSTATFAAATVYGAEVSFTTNPTVAVVPTLAATSASSLITQSSARTGGSITASGGAAITESGIVWGTATAPTITNTKVLTNPLTSFGAFISNISGLSPGTTYYVRSFATNSVGTSYGTEINFSTSKVAPVLANTLAATGVSDVNATVGGNLTSTGGNVFTESGIVYSTSANPTIADSKTTTATAVSAVGVFNAILSGLTPNTTYYARSYVNSSGFGPVYGTQISFTTTSLPTTVGWALYNLTASTIQPTTQIGNIVALPMNTGSEWTGPSTANIGNTNNYLGTVSGTQNTTWYTAAKTSGIGAVYSPNKYLEFKVTANGNDFKINTLQFSAHEQSGSGGKLAAYYSIDNDATSFVNSTNLGIATLGNTLASTSTSTIVSPIPLLRSDSLAGKTYPLTVTGSEDIKFSPNIVLPNGKTFTLRIYSWSALSPDKSLDIRNVIMTSGTKWPVSVLDASTVSAIAATTATVGSGIVQNGGDAIIASGVVYSTGLNFYPTLSNSKLATSPVSSSGVFSVNLTGLVGATKYLVRSYATNASGYTAYGPLNSFITTDASTGATAPTLSATTAASAITSTSGVSGGNISGSGGSSITASGIVWGITATPDITLSTKTVETTNVVGTPFVSSVTGLNPITLYYVRSYATNAIGTTYGTAISFTTAAATVTTDAITAITNTTATAGGNIVSDGGNAITESGVVYAITTAPTTASTKIVTSPLTTTGTFVTSLTGLTAATKYFVRSYVINTATTTTYGPEVSFTTTNDVAATAPVMAATTVSGATATTATASVVITSNGGSPILSSGVVWSTSSIADGTDVTSISNRRTNGSGGIINLVPYTLYYARSYATNAIGTTYGAEVSFNSLNAASTLAATTIDGATISSTEVTANSSIINNGVTITESGFVIGTGTTPTTAVTATNFKFATSPLATSGNIVSSLTGLTAGTVYYVRSYAIYSTSVLAANTLPTFSTAAVTGATVYGAVVSFTTNPTVAIAPTVAAATAASIITQSSARTGGSITSSGGAAITESGIVWGTVTAPTTANTKVVTNPLVSLGAFVSDITGLNPGTTYYVRSFATNSVGTTYGTEINFTTSKVAPVIANTLAATSVADVTAIVGGNLTSTGGTGNITESGIVYSTTANPTILDSKTATATAITAPGTFNVSLAGLTSSTTYYARSYVTTPGFGTFYGAQISFTTTATVLPLRITSFTAKAAESGVALKWTTASEVNVKGFEVERRTASSNFAPVSGLIIAGLNTYSFIDQNVQNEVYYYRIKASDYDGAVNHSEIVSVNFNLSANVSVQAYPNPATDKITITHQVATNGSKVQVIGLNGSVYVSALLKVGDTQTSLDVSKLDAGVYIILINEQNKISSIKFIKN